MSDPLTILPGDCRHTLTTLPDASVQCCVTSPPYWGLRSYLRPNDPLKPLEIGSERTPEEFIAVVVGVFREVRRVLRQDGTLWLNLGDTYAGGGNGGGGSFAKDGIRCAEPGTDKNKATRFGPRGAVEVKSKDLIGLPWRVALALQADGWWLRSDIIWHKPSPMPESVTDRPTKAHEYIFLLTKSPRYHYDAEAIREDCSPGTHPRRPGNGLASRNGSQFHDGKNAAVHPNVGRNRKHGDRSEVKNHHGFDAALAVMPERRNKRSVWTVASQPYAEAHFATFPPALIQPCILAGCPAGGTVLDPFGGSGTTGQVALELGRKAILCELNADYLPLIKRRTNITPGLPLAA